MSVLPMPMVFKACSDVLDVECIPMHYADLTERALVTLGSSRLTVDWPRQIEDVREKMLIAGRFGSGYVGSPHCLAFKRSWFPGAEDPTLFNLDAGDSTCVRFATSPRHFINAGTEALCRAPHMLTKVASSRRRWLGCMIGLSVEHHVKAWFQRSWPKFYEDPDNEGRFADPCNHDFKLRIGSTHLLVDVFSSGASREWRAPAAGKPRADLHLACEFDRDAWSVLWRSVTKGDEYSTKYYPEAATSPLWMRAWLNCRHADLPYDEIVSAASVQVAA